MNIDSILNFKFQGIIKALIKFKAIQGFALNIQALFRGVLLKCNNAHEMRIQGLELVKVKADFKALMSKS